MNAAHNITIGRNMQHLRHPEIIRVLNAIELQLRTQIETRGIPENGAT